MRTSPTSACLIGYRLRAGHMDELGYRPQAGLMDELGYRLRAGHMNYPDRAERARVSYPCRLSRWVGGHPAERGCSATLTLRVRCRTRPAWRARTGRAPLVPPLLVRSLFYLCLRARSGRASLPLSLQRRPRARFLPVRSASLSLGLQFKVHFRKGDNRPHLDSES